MGRVVGGKDGVAEGLVVEGELVGDREGEEDGSEVEGRAVGTGLVGAEVGGAVINICT